MQAAIKNVRTFMLAPRQVWLTSGTLAFIGSAIALDSIETFVGATDSPLPILALWIAGTLSLVEVFHRSPRTWAWSCHFVRNWSREVECKRQRRERERANRRRLEQYQEDREQALRVRRAKYLEQVKREARELRDEEEGGNDAR
jgi:hypothetical protein